MVTRESEWDTTELAKLLALEAWESSLCPCGCGFPAEWTRDKRNHFTFETDTCPVGAAGEAFQRKQQVKDEKAAKGLENEPGRLRPSDGRTWGVRLLSDEEVAAHQAKQLRSTPPSPRRRKRGAGRG